MDGLRFKPLGVTLLICILAACAGQPAAPAPAPIEPTAIPAPAIADTAAPAEAAPVAAAPALPAMEVGSVFMYFDGVPLVAVPGGPFIMGGGGPDNPIRTVDVGDFWIYQVEVTNRMYALCVDLGVCSTPDLTDNPGFIDSAQANKPVVGVNWEQASTYCEFVNGRLPTEAESEKTARGPDGNKFPWGDEGPLCTLLNFDACMNKTNYVGTYPDGESFYKALDMSGNVFEWVADWYLATYYDSAPTQDPPGPAAGTKRSVRSSAYNTDGYLTESSRRFQAKPEDHRADLGFRCVIGDPTALAPLCAQLLAYGKPAPLGQGTAQLCKTPCNEPEILMAEVNCKQTNVKVDTGGGPLTVFDIDTDHCTLVSEYVYWCEPGAGSVKVCGDCKGDKPTEVSCAAGYHQEGKRCVIDHGRPGRCPKGLSYDESLLCCTPITGKGNTYPVCPHWATYIPGATEDDPGYCLAGNCPGRKCDEKDVTFKQGCGESNKPDCDEYPDDPACGDGGQCNGVWVQVCDNSGACHQECRPSTGACLSPITLIDTPAGPVAVENLQVGDSVWTVDVTGARTAATILKASSVPVSASHQMVHLALLDGRELWASPQHPTADGRILGDLEAGDALGGSLVSLVELLPYGWPATHDVLPSGDTGYYWANGILLGSTLSGE